MDIDATDIGSCSSNSPLSVGRNPISSAVASVGFLSSAVAGMGVLSWGDLGVVGYVGWIFSGTWDRNDKDRNDKLRKDWERKRCRTLLTGDSMSSSGSTS